MTMDVSVFEKKMIEQICQMEHDIEGIPYIYSMHASINPLDLGMNIFY
jgi:hypothetical protein